MEQVDIFLSPIFICFIWQSFSLIAAFNSICVLSLIIKKKLLQNGN